MKVRTPASSVLAAVVLMVVAACGSGAPGADGSVASPAPSQDGSVFPVTIEHALGTAEITSAPTRVVTLGQGSAETALALGVTPVAVEGYEWGSDDTGYLPWIHEAVTAAGDELPQLLPEAGDLSVEDVAAMEPDLILAVWSGIDQGLYDQLVQIAPTVAYPDLAWSTDWDDQIETVATALGQGDRAEELQQGVLDTLEAVRDDNPSWSGLTFAYLYTTGPGTLGAFLPDEQRVAVVRAMGLTVDPVVSTYPETEGTDSAVLSLENAADFASTDLVFTFYSTEENRAQVEAQPLYAQIPAVSAGAVVAPTDRSLVTASSIMNPLTVPWMVEEFSSLIAAAVAARTSG